MARRYLNDALAARSRRKLKAIQDASDWYDQAHERDILKVITSTCDAAGVPYMRNYNTLVITLPSGERIMAKLPPHQLGKPDVTVLCRKSLTMWVETKALKGVLTEDQLRWKNWILTRGHEYHAPRTVEEAHNVSRRILELGR